MTRILSIVVALLAFSTVLMVSAAYAAPVAHAAVSVGDDTCLPAPSPATAISGKFCVKRHSLGLPCNPVPAILPVCVTLAVVSSGALHVPHAAPEPMSQDASRHFRPPRSIHA